MYYPGDGNWWLGAHSGGQLQWRFAGNTLGAARPTPAFPVTCQPLAGQVSEISAEIRALQADLQQAAPGQKAAIVRQIRMLQVRLAPIRAQLTACVAANTPPPPPPWPNFGQVSDGRPIWIGRISRSDRSEVLFYFPGDGNWWLGTLDGPEMRWTFAGNTLGFGHGINVGRPFWTGRFSRPDKSQLLFYWTGDGNCWLGTDDGTAIGWALEATFES
jgi:hypothetical protein